MWLSQWGGESAISIILEKKDEVREKGTLGCTLDNALRELFRHTTCYFQIIWASAWDFQQCGMCHQQSLRPVCAYAQSDQSLCLSLEYSMIVKLLTEHHLEFLSLKGGCRGLTESTHIKMPHCWKLHVLAQLCSLNGYHLEAKNTPANWKCWVCKFSWSD